MTYIDHQRVHKVKQVLFTAGVIFIAIAFGFGMAFY